MRNSVPVQMLAIKIQEVTLEDILLRLVLRLLEFRHFLLDLPC